MFCQTWIMRALLTVLFIAFAVGLRLVHSHSPIDHVATQPQPAAATTSAPIPAEVPTKPAQPSIDSVEVCGVGKLPNGSPDLQAIQSMTGTKQAVARRQWLDAMRQSGDIRARATGLLYAVQTQREESRAAPTETAVAPLVHLALDAQDPVVYAIAVYACQPAIGGVPGGSCDKIKLADWAALDADNAIPWLTIAAAARAAKDSAAESAAYAKAAVAKRYDTYAWSLIANAEPLIPASASSLDRHQLTSGFIGFEAAIGQPTVSQLCSVTAMVNPTVRTQCAALAELMVTKGTTLIDLSAGITIAQRVGWPADRIAHLRERRDAFTQLMLTQPRSLPTNPQDQFKCDVLEQENAHTKEWAHRGELGSLELDFERSGKTIAELAREYRGLSRESESTAK